MGDIQRTVTAKLRLTEEGDAEVFGKTAEEITTMQEATAAANAAADNLGKTFERASNAVASGSVRAAGEVVKAKVAVAAYQTAIENAEKAGVHIGDGVREGLLRVEKGLEAATVAAGKLTAAQQQAQRASDDATQSAGGQVQQYNSLNDIVRDLGGNIGVMTLRWGAAAGAVLVAHTALEKAESQLNEVAKALGGVGDEFDGVGDWVTGWSAVQKAVDGAARVIVDAKGHVEQYTGAVDEQIAAHRRAREEFVAARKPILEQADAVDKAEAAYKKWREGLGPLGKQLDEVGGQMLASIERLAREENIPVPDLAARFGPVLQKLVAQYGSTETAIRKSLEATLQDWQRLTAGIQREAEAQDRRIKDLGQKMTLEVEAFSKVVDKAEAAIKKLGEAGQKGEGAKSIDDLGDSFGRAKEGAESLIATCERLYQVLEGDLKDAALRAGAVIWGVFYGTPQVGGAGPGGGAPGYDPLGVYKNG